MNARELLIEWANGEQHWVRALVREVLVTRQPVSEAALDNLYPNFLIERGLREGELDEVPSLSLTDDVEEAVESLVLESLGNLENVNRLTNSQTIQFNPRLTVLFGENATGKSGYVRVLKRVANVRSAEDILPDITADSSGPPSAEIPYRLGETAHPYAWSGESGEPPFSRISVFDSRAMAFHVDDDLTYQYTPRELALFTYSHQAIDSLNARLKTDRTEAKPTKNPFLEKFQQGSSVYPHIESLSAATDLSTLESLGQVPKEEQDGLPALKETVDALKSGNLTARLQVATSDQELLEELSSAIDSAVDADFGAYNSLVAAADTASKKHLTANQTAFEHTGIPNVLSEPWKDFIQAADAYRKSIEDADDETCLYCRQELGTDAVELMKKYHEYCNNTLKSDLDQARQKVSERATSLTVSELPALSAKLDKRIASLGDKLPESLKNARAYLDTLQPLLEQLAANKKAEFEAAVTAAKIAKPKIDAALQKSNDQVQSLRTQGKDRQTKLAEETKKLRNLEDRLKLHELLDQIRKHVENAKWAEKATAISRKIPPVLKSLTEQEKVASEDLLNQDFEKLFQKECGDLNAPKVELKFPSGGAATSRRKSLDADHKLSEILSEGEQKVIALADFLAEAAVRAGSAPILFDDPVNSLDYRRLEHIVDRLAELSASHQVIVFTHNIWFATALLAKFEDSKATREHCSYYNVERHDDGTAGVVTAGSHPKWDTPGQLKPRLNTLIASAEPLTGEVRQAVVEKGYSLLRSWCEVVTEQQLLAGVTQRYSPHVGMGKLENIKPELLADAITEINAVFAAACRVTDAHSQPLETLGVPPSLDELKKQWKRGQDARDAYIKA